MTIIINGTTGISGVDGSSATPAMQGNDSNTGISYGTDTVTINTGGVARVTTDSLGNVFAPFDSTTAKLVVGGNGTISSLGAMVCVKSPISAGASLNYALNINDSLTNVAGGQNLIGWSHNQEDYSAANVRASIGATIDGGGAGSLVFRTGGYSSTAERMRIDSSGNLLMGTTSGSARFRINKSSLDGVWMMQGFTDGTEQLRIDNSGSILNALGSYGAFSDLKLKENIVDATPKLEKLNKIRVVNYNLIGHKEKLLGVVAQELEQIFPSMIDEVADRDDEGNDLGTTTKSVKYSVFVPMLIKAIQEQQALITQLQAEVDALKEVK